MDQSGQEVNRNQVGGTIVLLEEIAIDDVRILFQVKLANSVEAALAEIFIDLDSNGVGVELLRGHNHDPAVARPEIVNFFAGFKAAELQHLVDDGLRSRVIGRQGFGVLRLRRQNPRQTAPAKLLFACGPRHCANFQSSKTAPSRVAAGL